MKRVPLYLLGLLAAAVVSLPADLSAQMAVNVGGGLSFATLVGDDAEPGPGEEKSSRTGFFFGANLAIPVASSFGVSPGAYYVQKGVKVSDTSGEATFKVDYIEIPLLANFILSPGEGSMAVNIFLGPSISFEVGCSLEGSAGGASASVDCPDADADNRETMDFGAVAGAGVSFPVGERLSIGISGGVDFGLRKLDTSSPAEDIKHRGIFAGAHVGIPIG